MNHCSTRSKHAGARNLTLKDLERFGPLDVTPPVFGSHFSVSMMFPSGGPSTSDLDRQSCVYGTRHALPPPSTHLPHQARPAGVEAKKAGEGRTLDGKGPPVTLQRATPGFETPASASFFSFQEIPA